MVQCPGQNYQGMSFRSKSGLRRCCEGSQEDVSSLGTFTLSSWYMALCHGEDGAPPAPVRPGRQGPVSECDRRPLAGQRHAIEIRTYTPAVSEPTLSRKHGYSRTRFHRQSDKVIFFRMSRAPAPGQFSLLAPRRPRKRPTCWKRTLWVWVSRSIWTQIYKELVFLLYVCLLVTFTSKTNLFPRS